MTDKEQKMSLATLMGVVAPGWIDFSNEAGGPSFTRDRWAQHGFKLKIESKEHRDNLYAIEIVVDPAWYDVKGNVVIRMKITQGKRVTIQRMKRRANATFVTHITPSAEFILQFELDEVHFGRTVTRPELRAKRQAADRFIEELRAIQAAHFIAASGAEELVPVGAGSVT